MTREALFGLTHASAMLCWLRSLRLLETGLSYTIQFFGVRGIVNGLTSCHCRCGSLGYHNHCPSLDNNGGHQHRTGPKSTFSRSIRPENHQEILIPGSPQSCTGHLNEPSQSKTLLFYCCSQNFVAVTSGDVSYYHLLHIVKEDLRLHLVE